MRLDVLSPRVLPYALTVGFLAIGALVGLVVATGNLVMIALVLGAVAGLLLLNALPAAMWILLIGAFLINGPVIFFNPGSSKIAWLFSLLGIFMAGAAVLYAAVGRERHRRPMPVFVYVGLGFALLAAAGVVFSNGPMAEIVAGAKRQFHYWGVMFLLAVVPFSPRQVRGWLIFLCGAALVQLPLALYQRVVLVPQVAGYEGPGFVPFDIIVGSFEGSIYGGGASSIMAMFLVLASVGLFCAYREGLIGTGRFWLLLLPVMIPLGLGETKVVLLLYPVVLFAAYADAIAKRPLAFLGSALVMLVVGAALAYFYFAVQVSGEMSVAENLEDTIAYNFGRRGYYGTGVNRMTAVPYWFEAQTMAEPLRFLFGWGMGSSYGSDGRVPLPGHMFAAHDGMYIDLVTMSLILWDFGLVGALLFFGMVVGAGFTALRCFNEARTGWDRVLCRILLGSIGASLVMTLYSASIIILASHSFIFSLVLGLVAWRARHGPLEPSPAEKAAFSRRRPASGGPPRRPSRGGRPFGPIPTVASPGFAESSAVFAAARQASFRPAGATTGASAASSGAASADVFNGPRRSGRGGHDRLGKRIEPVIDEHGQGFSR